MLCGYFLILTIVINELADRNRIYQNMAYFQNNDGIDDEQLEEQMSKCLQQGYQRTEMLEFLRRDFPQYAWSICTLDR